MANFLQYIANSEEQLCRWIEALKNLYTTQDEPMQLADILSKIKGMNEH